MWAIAEIGKKQYFVEKGETIEVERLKEQAGELLIDKVLLVADDDRVSLGAPYVDGAQLKCEVLGEEKGEKVLIYKYRRRKKYRRTQGHRQIHTRLKISDIIIPTT